MAESFDAVLATDELLCALAERRTPKTQGDPVIEALASLARYADAPTISSSATALPAAAGRHIRRGRRRLGLAIGVALACTSSGIAAAVTGDPLLPVTFIARHLVMFGDDLGVDHSSSQPDRQLASTLDRVDTAPHLADAGPVDAVEHRHPPRERVTAPQDEPATPHELPPVVAS
ncbi:MAG: hypothetical protein H0U36_12435, partial [Nocardioidaceae bacterium]|nr:hypothetical protein [Nocardioidaceae bacterium]